MPNNFSKSRILKNSILLYVRMLFTMWVNLYATRLVLANLGVEDMGVYGIVGSIVSLFTLFTDGITRTIQRFITYELGFKKGNVNNIFCTSLNVLIILSIAVIIILEIGGLWLLNNKVNIPESSSNASFLVFQLSILTCVINIISIPYNSLVIAYEKMNVFAFISIIQTLLTCAGAYSLSFFANNRLVIYAIIMAVIAISIRFIYQMYCHVKFPESKYHLIIDKNKLLAISKFAGLTSISSMLSIITTQGITFAINLIFGVALNAVYTIAVQVKNSVMSFAFNLFKAIQPQITKTYAEGNYETHKKLVYSGSKIEVYLIYLILIPFIFKTEFILQLWLNKVPEYTSVFCRCTIFLSLTYAAFEPIRQSVLSSERIAKFIIIPDTFNLLSLPISYTISLYTRNPNDMIYTIVSFEILTCIIRTYIATRNGILSGRSILKHVLIPCIKVMIISSLCCYLLTQITSDSITDICILLLLNSLTTFICIYICGLSQAERLLIKNLLNKHLRDKYVIKIRKST